MNIAMQFGLTVEERSPLDLAAMANPLRNDAHSSAQESSDLTNSLNRLTIDGQPTASEPTQSYPTRVTFSGLKPLATSKVAAGGNSLTLPTATVMNQQQASASPQNLGLKLSEIIRFASAAPDGISTAEFGER